MNNLTTRKIVLGLLMALVLAFGVPGVVDAIVDPVIDELVLNPTGLYNVGGPATISSITITPDKAATRETVSISKTSGITLTGDFYGLSSVSLKEVDEDLTDGDNNQGSSFTYTRDGRTQTISGRATGAIGITFTAKGKQTVTISSTNGTDSWSYKYTYYVKGPGTSTTTISLVGLSNGYKAGIFSDDAHRIPIHNGDNSHYDVYIHHSPQ